MEPIYMDYAATTPVRPEVSREIYRSLQEHFANPSSVYQTGKKSKAKLRQARQRIQKALDLEGYAIYFTSGATEANNWAIISQARRARELGYGNHIVATTIEHPSVHEVLLKLEYDGFKISWVNPLKAGQMTVDQFEVASTETTIGWIAMAVNNEVGSILPIGTLSEAAERRGIWFHCDVVQAIAHQNIIGPTSMTLSAHKLAGPKGVGILAYRSNDKAMSLQPLIAGGGQESGKRSGTENLPYIMGMALAIELMVDERPINQSHYKLLSDYLYRQLKLHQITYQRNGDPAHHVDNIHSLYLPGQLASQLLIKADLKNIYLSAGSACSAGSILPSRILRAYYPDNEARWQESIRISFGPSSKQDEIDAFISLL